MVTRLGLRDGRPPEICAGGGFPDPHGRHGLSGNLRRPAIFIQSTHDEFGPREQLEALVERLPGPKQLHWVEASDHFFAGGLEQLEEVVLGVAESF